MTFPYTYLDNTMVGECGDSVTTLSAPQWESGDTVLSSRA